MTVLCWLHDIPDGEARGFEVAGRSLLVLRLGWNALAYENRCPHVGLPLEWQPDRFISADGAYLQCANHGALFEKTSGRCVHGPCLGRHLRAISIAVENGRVLLDD